MINYTKYNTTTKNHILSTMDMIFLYNNNSISVISNDAQQRFIIIS